MSSSDLLTAFRKFCGRHRLLDSAEYLVAAVSGGIDSMVLLDLLKQATDGAGVQLAVAHVNHGLRGAESDADEDFVRRAATEATLPFHLHTVVHGADNPAAHPSVQERAREERYAFFETIGRTHPRARIATAHNRDDNAETVLFNFLRGTGVHGLTGIPVTRRDGYIVRPLLFASREEVRRYASAHGIAFREDSSNATLKYTRNVLRHDLIPSIESGINPGVKNTMLRTSELFGELESYLQETVGGLLPGIIEEHPPEEVRLDISKIQLLHPFLRESVLHTLGKRYLPRGIQYTHVRTLERMLTAPTGASCRVSGELYAYVDRNTLIMRRSPPPAPFRFNVEVDDTYQFGDFSFSASRTGSAALGQSPTEEYIDGGLLGKELLLRSWNEGDWFVPIGLGARKKVSDFFVDQKVPVTEKRRIPIFVSDGTIVWICGYRLDDRFKITPATTSVIKLSYGPAAE